MNSWILLAIASHAVLGASGVIDKIILKNAIPRPGANAFYLGVLGVVSFAFVPFGFAMPNAGTTALAILAGAAIVYGFLLYFIALDRSESSRIIPMIAGWTPMFVLLLSAPVAGSAITSMQLGAFVLLVVGSVLLSANSGEPYVARSRARALAILAALCFAIATALAKLVFNHAGFVSGFVLIKAGGIAAALTLLAVSRWRKEIFEKTRASSGALFVANRTAAGLASIGLNGALVLGVPALVDAMRGVQLVAVFIGAFMVRQATPHLLRESFDRAVIVRKVIATVCVAVGIAALSL